MSAVEKETKSRHFPHKEEPSFERIEVSDDKITAFLTDGRSVSVPLWWSYRLERATPEQRASWSIIGDGRIVEWEDIDEHLSMDGFLHGTPAPG